MNAALFNAVMFNQAGSAAQGGSFFYLFDQSASTRFLLDSSAAITDSNVYRAFGEKVLDEGETKNPHGFHGQVGPITDAFNRVVMGHRVYDPETGQWYSIDPIGFDGMDWNLYRFVFNDPISLYDPEGLSVPAALASCVPLIGCGVALGGCYPCGSDLSCWQTCISDTINDFKGTFQGDFCINALRACKCALSRGRRGVGRSRAGSGRAGTGKPQQQRPNKGGGKKNPRAKSCRQKGSKLPAYYGRIWTFSSNRDIAAEAVARNIRKRLAGAGNAGKTMDGNVYTRDKCTTAGGKHYSLIDPNHKPPKAGSIICCPACRDRPRLGQIGWACIPGRIEWRELSKP